MKQVRVSDEVYRRLQEYADGRPLGKAIERLLGAIEREDEADRALILQQPQIPAGEGIGGHPMDVLRLECTCGPGEKARGKHNRYCPLRGK